MDAGRDPPAETIIAEGQVWDGVGVGGTRHRRWVLGVKGGGEWLVATDFVQDGVGVWEECGEGGGVM